MTIWVVPTADRGSARADMKSAPTGLLSVNLMGLGLSPPETWSRFAPGFDSSFRRGRCPHRPARRRVHRPPPTAPVGADYISARNQVGSTPAWQPTRPGTDAPCAPLRWGAFGGGTSDAAVRRGRAYSPPLREGRWRDRRGGLYGRPWRSCGFRKPAVERGAARAGI